MISTKQYFKMWFKLTDIEKSKVIARMTNDFVRADIPYIDDNIVENKLDRHILFVFDKNDNFVDWVYV